MSSISSAEITWNKSLEEYLCNISEKCEGYSWLHKRAEELFSRRTIFLDIPAIFLYAITGFLNVGSSQIFKNDDYSPVYLGAVSLLVSLIQTINSYFSWQRRAENHKICSNSYAKLFRFISTEMSTKPRDERMNATKMLEKVRNEYDQLGENSPLIPPQIIEEFNKKFENLKDFSRPEECNGLHAVYPYSETEIVPPPPSPMPYINTPKPISETINIKIDPPD